MKLLPRHNRITRLGVSAKKNRTNVPAGRGAKCTYEPGYHPKMIKWMCRAGATDEEIASEFGMSVRQLYRWYKLYPELCQAKTAGKNFADFEVEESLFKRALGYDIEETEVVATKDGKPMRVKKTKKHIPGDVRACRLWLINRQSKRWRDRSDSGELDRSAGRVLIVDDIGNRE